MLCARRRAVGDGDARRLGDASRVGGLAQRIDLVANRPGGPA